MLCYIDGGGLEELEWMELPIIIYDDDHGLESFLFSFLMYNDLHAAIHFSTASERAFVFWWISCLDSVFQFLAHYSKVQLYDIVALDEREGRRGQLV